MFPLAVGRGGAWGLAEGLEGGGELGEGDDLVEGQGAKVLEDVIGSQVAQATALLRQVFARARGLRPCTVHTRPEIMHTKPWTKHTKPQIKNTKQMTHAHTRTSTQSLDQTHKALDRARKADHTHTLHSHTTLTHYTHALHSHTRPNIKRTK